MKKTTLLLINTLLIFALLFPACNDNNEDEEMPAPVINSLSATEITIISGQMITLQISGENFGTDASMVQVTLNGVDLAIQSITDGQIEVEIPEYATSGNITVTVDGKSASSPVLTINKLDEDCIAFNANNLSVQQSGSNYDLIDGSSILFNFESQSEAQTAEDILKFYEIDNICFAIRPNSTLQYLKVAGDIPAGSFTGEDCLPVDAQNLTIDKVSDTQFRIQEGSSLLFSAKSLEEAEKIVEIYETFNPTHTCFVGRPNPGMMYLRK